MIGSFWECYDSLWSWWAFKARIQQVRSDAVPLPMLRILQARIATFVLSIDLFKTCNIRPVGIHRDHSVTYASSRVNRYQDPDDLIHITESLRSS